jgi:hypothetical protein
MIQTLDPRGLSARLSQAHSLDPNGDEKYSFQFREYMKRQALYGRSVFVAFIGSENISRKPIEYDPSNIKLGQIIICHGTENADSSSYFSGIRLNDLVRGSSRSTKFDRHDYNLSVIDDWFDGYLAQGVCHIDKRHVHYPSRWINDGDIKICKHCGHSDASTPGLQPLPFSRRFNTISKGQF